MVIFLLSRRTICNTGHCHHITASPIHAHSTRLHLPESPSSSHRRYLTIIHHNCARKQFRYQPHIMRGDQHPDSQFAQPIADCKTNQTVRARICVSRQTGWAHNTHRLMCRCANCYPFSTHEPLVKFFDYFLVRGMSPVVPHIVNVG